ncbi:YrdB family protein [Kitasatospora sp. NPDC092039]|uniref:YrdB family protein n=1 Tax=Kitasatospora sp. NPDC092039 TaxID=3364086 RepID=UPI0038137D0A
MNTTTTDLALAYNPVFLGLRFLLELFALYGFGVWGWRKAPGALRYLAVVAIPVVVAVVWGDFATAGDEARSGETTFDTPGPIRLLLEFAVFGGAAAGLWHAGMRKTAQWFLIVLVVYHVASYDRIWWLLQH